jgi:CelD/BcsL family acetyltransferase involved in cellulose biosynthesis
LSTFHTAEPLLRIRSDGALARPSPATDVAAADAAIALKLETDLDTIAAEWCAFQEEADGTAFQTYAWQSTWLKTIGAHRRVTPVIVTGRLPSGRLLFLLSLAIEAAGRGTRRLTWLASDLNDYNGPLLAPDFSALIGAERFTALWSDIYRLIRASGLPYDLVDLPKLPERIGGQPNPFRALGGTLNPSGAHLTHLPADFDTYYAAKRSNASRKRDRWRQRRLADQGEVRFSTAEEPETVSGTIATLYQQKSRSLARMGAPDMFAMPGQADFYRELARTSGGLVHIARLDVGDVMAAANFGLVFRGRYYHVLASYAEGEVARFGPGGVHLQHLFRYAMERGCNVFDFTIGDEAYKREWSEEELKLYDVRRAASPLGFALLLPALTINGLKRTIKQTPVLWRMAQAARAMLARIRPAAPKAQAESDEAGEV